MPVSGQRALCPGDDPLEAKPSDGSHTAINDADPGGSFRGANGSTEQKSIYRVPRRANPGDCGGATRLAEAFKGVEPGEGGGSLREWADETEAQGAIAAGAFGRGAATDPEDVLPEAQARYLKQTSCGLLFRPVPAVRPQETTASAPKTSRTTPPG